MSGVDPALQGDLFRWQKPVAEIGDRSWDVIVIGAGPAGTSAAYHLGRSGLRVLLADRAQFPRQKVCGDCMITDINANLNRLGLRDAIDKAGHTIKAISVHSPSGFSFDVPGRFVTLRRPDLDAILARNAVGAGAVFVSGHVSDLSINADETVSVNFRGLDGPMEAKIAIVATGAGVGLARKLRTNVPMRPSALAMRRYVRSDHRIENLTLSYSRRILPGYRWIVPLGKGEYNIGCGHFLGDGNEAGIRVHFDEFVTDFLPARELVRKGEYISPPRSAAMRCGLDGTTPLVGRSVLFTGEMIGATLLMTGEGIGQAMTTGWMAAAAVDRALGEGNREHLAAYVSDLESEIRPRHIGFRRAQAWMSRPWLNDLLAWRMNRSRYLRGVCAGFLGGHGNPRSLYSVRAIFKSFFR